MSFKKQFKTLINRINESNHIYLFRHINPDPDALGSSFGLREIIRDNFKNKKIYNIGKEYPILEHLFPKPNKMPKKMNEKSLAIITDTANVSRIDGDFWNECSYIVKIDHHPKIEKFGNLQIINSESIATAEIVAHWAIESNLKISKKAAEYLYLGILTDSGRFMFPNTSSQTFRIAAKLLECGIDIAKLHQKLYTKELKHGKMQSYIINNMKITNKVAHILITKKEMKALKMSIEEVKLHANALAGYKEIDIWVLGIEDDGFIRTSSRSKPKYKINKVAARFHGGGHQNAAGAKLKTKTEFKKLVKEFKKIIK